MNGAAILSGIPRQVEVYAGSKADVSAHGFWKRGTTAILDICIVNLDAGSYQRMNMEKALANLDKEKKDLYLQDCLEGRQTFTPMVYSLYEIPGAEALTVQKI